MPVTLATLCHCLLTAAQRGSPEKGLGLGSSSLTKQVAKLQNQIFFVFSSFGSLTFIFSGLVD